MADQPTSLEDLLSCFICTNEFEQSGDHVPRLLPCTHTLCEKCIKELTAFDSLKCPFCKQSHPAKQNETSFSQNKYILNQMKRISMEEKQKTSRCEEHGKELSLFCKEPGCQTPICVTCLRRHHRKHDFVEMEEEMEALMEDIERVQSNLLEKRKVLQNLQEDVEKKTEKCVTTLSKRIIDIRKEVDKHFEEMLEEAANVRDNVNYQVDCVVDDINENVMILESIKQDRGQNGNIRELVDTLKNVYEHCKHDLCGTRTFHFPEYETSFIASRISYGLGSIQKQEVVAKFPEVTEDLATLQLQPDQESEPESALKLKTEPELEFRFRRTYKLMRDLEFKRKAEAETAEAETDVERCVTNTRELTFTGVIKFTIDTGLDRCSSLALLSNGSASVCGVDDGERMLNMHTGVKMSKLGLNLDSYGIVEIIHAGKPTLVVAYGKKDDVHAHSKIHFVDCTESNPRNMSEKRVRLTDRTICDMTYTNIQDKELLVTTNRQKGIKCYNIDTKSLEWSVHGRLTGMKKVLDAAGVTTDGHGHLLVCDFENGNDCVQMFSVLDGQYLRCVAQDIWNELGQPGMIRWYETASPFVVLTTRKRNRWYISKIDTEYRSPLRNEHASF